MPLTFRDRLVSGRRHTPRLLVAGLLLVLLVFGASACGGGSDDDAAGRADKNAARRSTTSDDASTTTSDPTSTTSEATGATTTTPPQGGNDVQAAISLIIEVTNSPGQAVRAGTLSCGDAAAGTGFLADPQAAEAACSLLRTQPAAVRRLVEGRAPDLMCTQIYGGPEVARVTGQIDGQPVNATIDRTDGCGIGEWNMLNPLLGPAGA